MKNNHTGIISNTFSIAKVSDWLMVKIMIMIYLYLLKYIPVVTVIIAIKFLSVHF